MAQRLKRLPAMKETWVRSLSREDPLEKEMASHSSILAWRIPWTEEPGGLHGFLVYKMIWLERIPSVFQALKSLFINALYKELSIPGS